MEAYTPAYHPHMRTSHLTKLYSDAKKSALISLEVHHPNTSTQQFSALHRKYRIQKDRLITWGLAWSDDEKGPDGSIDESVAKAGLTETVDSVLRNIKEVTDEAERIKAVSAPGLPPKAGEKHLPAVPFDDARYEDLLQDLTASIDTLYDLSRSRRALARGELPLFTASTDDRMDEKPSATRPSSIRKSLFKRPSYASSELTLVDPPPFARPSLSPYSGLPPRIDVGAIRLPEERPPPYESLGVPSTTRLIGVLVRSRTSESTQNALGSTAAEVPVLVEYANFDSVYRETGVPPPLQRLESLGGFLRPMRPESQTNLSILGYFEDFSQPRIGLVYDLPYSVQNRLQGNIESAARTISPISLLKLVKKASKVPTSGSDGVVPPLEDRFSMALALTEQLHTLHDRGIAHGNINSSSVIFATTEQESSASRRKQSQSPLWASFDLFSKCTVEGVKRKANLNIYKHPEDQPLNPGRSVSVDLKFDMYGLALLLLEIGLWTPVGDLYKAKYSLSDFKLRLEKLWIPKLAAKCGSSYMRAVQACLAAADDLDLSGSTTAVQSAYETLTLTLERCRLLDEGTTTESLPADSFAENPSSATAAPSVRRKPLPSKTSPFTRQQSDFIDPDRTQSVSSTVSSLSRLSSVPNLPAETYSDAQYVTSPPADDEPPIEPSSRRQNLSGQSPLKTRTRFTSAPSFKEYKHSVLLIQRSWRRHRARRAEVQPVPQRSIEVPTMSKLEREDQRQQPKRREFPEVQLPQAIVDDWHNRASMHLARLVEKALRGSPESSSIGLTAYGETPETARPTYLVCCTSTVKVKQILKRHFKFDPTLCDVRVKRDEVKRCRRSKRQGMSDHAYRTMASRDRDLFAKAINPDYQERPLCGASIGAFRDDDHLPPVSFGGVVLVDGQAYGMSVHHMLEADDDEDEEDDGADIDVASDSSSVRDFDNEETLSESDDDSTVRPSSTVFDTTHNPDSHDGDCPGIVPGDFEEIAITQPALDDAIDLDLHAGESEDEDEDDADFDSGIDEDHLLSYKLGQVHASSGLKRTPTSHQNGFKSISQSLPQEIDWALFELVPPRAHPYNIVKGGKKFCSAPSSTRQNTTHSYPVAILDSADLACTTVHCLGRTSGLASGVIASTMELVKIHGRSTFSASWTVSGRFGVGGDSGAWVISNDDGKVCGHVLARRQGRTYICPMDLLLEDIKRTLGARSVELPLPPPQSLAAARGKVEGSQSVERSSALLTESVRSLGLVETEDGGDGGVALPMRSSARLERCRQKPGLPRSVGTVGAAG